MEFLDGSDPSKHWLLLGSELPDGSEHIYVNQPQKLVSTDVVTQSDAFALNHVAPMDKYAKRCLNFWELSRLKIPSVQTR